MLLGVLADMVVAVHLAFVLFVVLGGFLALWRPKILWVHAPAVLWAGVVECAGWVCPLTPIENRLRISAGEAGYSGDFVEHVLMPVLYPSALTRDLQLILGIGAVALNVGVYALVFLRRRGGAQNGPHLRKKPAL